MCYYFQMECRRWAIACDPGGIVLSFAYGIWVDGLGLVVLDYRAAGMLCQS